MSATAAGSRAHSVTSRPARAAQFASAVPQAPAPTTAMRSNAISATPAAAGSSGQRARGATSSVSVSPRASRSQPAQAIIAPLSVHSAGGGATSTVPSLVRDPVERAADRLVDRDAARDHQRGRSAELLAEQAQAGAQPVGHDIHHRLLERGAQIRDVLIA